MRALRLSIATYWSLVSTPLTPARPLLSQVAVALTLILSGVTFPTPSHAAPLSCAAVFSKPPLQTGTPEEVARFRRDGILKRQSPGVAESSAQETRYLNGRPYLILKTLAEPSSEGSFGFDVHSDQSSSNVVLARSSKGALVVVKTYSADNIMKPALAYHEAMATLFFRSLGVKVPRVIDIQISGYEVTVIKEYFEGLTYSDLDRNRLKMSYERQDEILDQYPLEKARLMALWNRTESSSAFSQWLESHQAETETRVPVLRQLRGLIENPDPKAIGHRESAKALLKRIAITGDFANRNWLWDPSSEKWLLIDP